MIRCQGQPEIFCCAGTNSLRCGHQVTGYGRSHGIPRRTWEQFISSQVDGCMVGAAVVRQKDDSIGLGTFDDVSFKVFIAILAAPVNAIAPECRVEWAGNRPTLITLRR